MPTQNQIHMPTAGAVRASRKILCDVLGHSLVSQLEVLKFAHIIDLETGLPDHLAALEKSLPVIQDNAENERVFWCSADRHGIAAEAEALFDLVKSALAKAQGGTK